MASKIFFDANVLLDLTLQRDNYADAKAIVELTEDNRIKAYVTPAIVQILAHYLTKYYGATDAKTMILTLLVNITVIDISHETVVVALNSQIRDIEDALPYYAAIHQKMDYFISLDKTLQKNSIPILPVLTPKEFIKIFL